MKKNLNELTIAQFIELLCGDIDVLFSRHEIPDKNKAELVMHNIVGEYRALADPIGNAAYLRRIEDLVKSRINLLVFTIAQNLAGINQYSQAKDVLTALSYDASAWDKKRVHGIITANIAKLQRTINELEQDNEVGDGNVANIRSQFDALTATLMAHFRFQIDPDTIKASVYANLVARYNREIKAKIEAMKAKKLRF